MPSASSGPATALRAAGFRGEILAEEPLAPFTTWRIGGPTEVLAQPEDRDELIRAVRWAVSSGTPWRVLGNGSNLLVRDEGVRGLVLRVRKGLARITVEGTRIRAEAGASFPAVANLAASRGLAGIEFGAGIPGTIGGAIVMNAGWHEFEIKNVVESVEVLEVDGSVETLDREACEFGYRKSALRGKWGVVLSAVLVLRPDDVAAVTAR